jgi:hypothetical protein
MNDYLGIFTDGEKRLIESAFRGWRITRPHPPSPQFQYEKGIYKAEFGPDTISAFSIPELVQLGLDEPGPKNGTIVPYRAVEDTSYPRQDKPLPEEWPEARAYQSSVNEKRLLKILGRPS